MPVGPASFPAQQHRSTAGTADEQSAASQQRGESNLWTESDPDDNIRAQSDPDEKLWTETDQETSCGQERVKANLWTQSDPDENLWTDSNHYVLIRTILVVAFVDCLIDHLLLLTVAY